MRAEGSTLPKFADPPLSPVLYCLRGSVEDHERTWLLPAGENTLGSSEANDLVLAVSGVSRQHARLRVDGEGVEVTDLSSTNGSFVNDERVERAHARPGDSLRFGPATLILEEIDPGDALLAFEIRPAASLTPSGLPDDESTERLQDPPPGLAPGGIEGVERFLDGLAAAPRRDAAAILEALMGELRAAGACLVEWSGRREPLLVASRGRVDDFAENGPLRSLVEEVARASASGIGGMVCRSGTSERPPLVFAVLGRPRTVPLALLLSGGPAGDGAEDLLRVALRLLGWLPGWGPAPASVSPGGPALPVLRFPPGFVAGASPAMERLYGEIRALCRGDLPVLVTGETGVGKEHVARILHASSARAGGPFEAMNCAALPAELLEAEMFGVAEGAATGVRAREGRILQAAGGTLFLDELGDMSLPLQAKLLRALQEKEVHPVGGRPVAVDVRFVAATNKDLLAEAEAGRFRSDLYYRIAGAVLTVPPLRERREDIPQLVQSFLHAAAKTADKGVRGLTIKALGTLVAYPWPGNVRELEHEVQRLVQACTPGQAIDSTMLPERFAAAALPAAGPEPEPDSSLRLERHVLELEGRLIRQALLESGGSQRKAAAALGISRNALTRKMQKLGIVG
jgi:two-component system response regulator HydG